LSILILDALVVHIKTRDVSLKEKRVSSLIDIFDSHLGKSLAEERQQRNVVFPDISQIEFKSKFVPMVPRTENCLEISDLYVLSTQVLKELKLIWTNFWQHTEILKHIR
jgi:hypothetical protein